MAEIVLAILDRDQDAMRREFVDLVSRVGDTAPLLPDVLAALLNELSWGLLRDHSRMPLAACHEMQIAPGSSFAAGAAKILAHSNRLSVPGDRSSLM